MIQFDNVKKSYGGECILDTVSFTLGKREKCSLIGRNGAGKTTIFRLICQQEEPDSGQITIPKGYRLGYLNQHIHFSEPSIVQEACLGLPEEEKESVYKAEAILSGLGFTKQQFEQAPSTLSGGYHLRLHLTKLLLSDPDCLLLDEPTNYLDILSIRWLANFLRTWPKELLMISHERLFLDSLVSHTIGIHRKKLHKIEGPSQKLYQQIALQEEVYEKSRMAIEKKRATMQAFVDRFGAKNTKAAQAQSRLKAIERLPELDALCAIENLDFHFPARHTPSQIIMKVQDLSFSYGTTPLISHLSFEVQRDARIGIIGKNGKGKSTLLQLLIGKFRAQSGSFSSITDLQIGYFGQTHIDQLHRDATVEEEIQRSNPLLSLQEVRSIAAQMMFSQARAEKKIAVLSGGEKSRVVLAKLLAAPCHLLLLDEPTNHLDVESMEAFMDALETFEGAVVIISHSELVLQRIAKELLVFQDRGQEVFPGTYKEFLEKDGWKDQEAATPSQKQEQTHKDLKRKRAEAVQERAKVLKPHLARAAELEAHIISLETEVETLSALLIQQASLGSSHNIAEHTKALKEKNHQIEMAFAELEAVTASIESEKKRFDI